jgi:MFS family permease
MATTLTLPRPAAEPLVEAPWRALPVIVLGAFLAVLDFFIVNVALPSLDGSLHAGAALLELVVAGYGVGYACTLVAGGRLGDLHGRRTLFTGGLALFTAASLACGLAPTAGTLVATRVVQGVAAGLMVPQGLALIQSSFVGRDRDRALGVYGAVLGAAGVTGQLVGGALVEANVAGLGWRAIFLVNVPLGTAGAFAAWRVLPDTRPATAARVDIPGTLLLAATVVLALVPLALGREQGWPAWCFVSLGAAALVLAAFAVTQARAERAGRTPLLPRRLLRVPASRCGLGAALTLFVAVGGFFLTTAITLQSGRGLSPLESALALVPFGLAFLGVSLASGAVAQRLGGGRAIVVGSLVAAVGLACEAALVLSSYRRDDPLWLALPMVLVGAGQAVVVVRLLAVVLAGIPPALAGAASGVLMTTIQLALATGAATIGTLFFSVAADRSWQAASVTALAVEAVLFALTAACARGLPA